MKKIVLLVSLSLLFAGSTFAADLADNLDATALSNGVTGFYYTNTAQSAYILQTGHDNGNRAFGSGSFATTVNYSDVTDPTADLLTGAGFDSGEFTSGSTWTAVGE